MENHTPPSGYGIGAVSRLTGLPAHTLRIWERRYGAVRTLRSAGGRRYYSDADVARLTLLKQLTDGGERIGRIANMDEQALRARLDQHAAHRVRRVAAAGTPRVAVLGDMLASQLAAGIPDCELVTRTTDAGLFSADLKRLRPDVLIIEQAALNQDTDALLGEWQAVSGAQRIVLVFGFARAQDVSRLASEVVVPVRAPVTAGELSALARAPGVSAAGAATASRPAPGAVPAQVTPRRFSAADLARLRQVQGTVNCECPTHIVDLVTSLSAFESYSAQCENRNPEDAALHAALHRTTARARALMEDALTRVAKAEGLL
jgi:hypothetical protein